MKAVVTRVSSASVTIEGRVNGAINRGYLVLLGVAPEDTEETAVKLADKICNLRVFDDENGKMNLDLSAVGGEPVYPFGRHLQPASRVLPRRPARRGRAPL